MNCLQSLKALSLMLGVLFFFGVACEERGIPVLEVTGEELTRINSGESKHRILILDVRSTEHYLRGHIKNAVSIPRQELAKRIDEIIDYIDRPVYVCSGTYATNFSALNTLVQHNFSKVFSAEGLGQFSYYLEYHQSLTARTFLQLCKDPKALIIDYRFKSAFNAGHLANAVHIEYGTMKICLQNNDVRENDMQSTNSVGTNTEEALIVDRNVQQLPRDKILLLYSNMGTAAAEGAEELVQAGYKAVYACIDGLSMFPFDLLID